MIGVLALVFAIPLGSAFLWLARCYPQQPPEDRHMAHHLPVRFGDTPKYVPPEEVAEQYYNHVRQSNKALIMRSWPSSASSFCGGISRN